MTDQRHEEDLDRVEGQNGVTDIVRGFEDRPQGGLLNRMMRSTFVSSPLGRTIADRTDFEKRDFDLNQLIDFVDQTDPEDLESSGKALWDARDAINAAADELEGHIDNVHWVGQSGDAFRKWGGSLVTNTHHLSDFAGAAGDQITAAAVGLASVRGAMPFRDSEASRKRPEYFTEAEKTADKGEYETAVRVEKDRQEAINQMNRLASYYAVSEEVLASLPAKDKTPEFTVMPDVGVPQPLKAFGDQPSASATDSHSAGTASVVGRQPTVTSDASRYSTSDNPQPAKEITGDITYPHDHVRTNIDSIGTLPPPTTAPVTGQTPPALGTPAPGGGQPSVFEGGHGKPVFTGTSGRNLSGTGGLRPPVSAQGRNGTPGLTNSGSGRHTGQGTMNQMGRVMPTGPSAASGVASGSHSSPMGRAFVGGTPQVGGTAVPRANRGPVTGAGRANGVVGGQPTTVGGASAKGGAAIPRGTVVGGEGAVNSRPATGLPGQRGVFGVSESTTRLSSSATSPRGSTETSEAITGRPAACNSVAGAEPNGLTRGGTGLVRDPGHGAPGDDGKAQVSPCLDHRVEAQETHLPDNPRRNVPPVAN